MQRRQLARSADIGSIRAARARAIACQRSDSRQHCHHDRERKRIGRRHANSSEAPGASAPEHDDPERNPDNS